MAGNWGASRPSWSPNFSFNVPDLPQCQIDGLPACGVAVYKGTADKTVDFCEALRKRLEEYEVGQCTFDNIDVSQVEWNALSFSVLLDVLQEKGASTKRLKAYKSSLDDDCIKQVAGWLESLPAEGLPSEVHLSHNQITKDGFDVLLCVIEAKRAELPQQAAPVWLRVENNKVEDSHLSSLVAQGKIALVPGIKDRRVGTASIAMPSFEKPKVIPAGGATASAPGAASSWSGGGSPGFQGGDQRWSASNGGGKGADPGGNKWWEKPADTNKWSGGSWQKDNGKWDAGGWKSQQATAAPQALPAAAAVPAYGGQGAWAAGGGGPRLVRPPGAGAAFTARPATAATWGRAGTAADRSRTPQFRQPKDGNEPQLPPGWEKHWSDEYTIPYYWNVETGESLWEAPT